MVIFVISEILRTATAAGDNPVAASKTTEATFQINSTKFSVSIVTLSINDYIKYSENMNQGFKRTVSWNK